MPDTDDRCETLCLHPEAITRAREALADEEALFDAAELFRTLGDQGRVRILTALSAAVLCVCDLAEILAMSQSAVSHHLRLLRAAKLVRPRKDGKNVFYSLDDEHVRLLFRTALDHVREE